MVNNLIAKWAKYYEDNGLQWLSSQHVAAIKRAFFAGAEATEQSAQEDVCEDCGATLVDVETLCDVCYDKRRQLLTPESRNNQDSLPTKEFYEI